MSRMRLFRRFAMLVLLICAALTVTASAAAPATPSSYNGLAGTPPMGFNDWNAYGCEVSAGLIESAARYMHTSGMQAAGYRYVNIDDCWLEPQRGADGHLVADAAKFPQGIPAVAQYVHSLGLKLGIYEDAAPARAPVIPAATGTKPPTPPRSPPGASTTSSTTSATSRSPTTPGSVTNRSTPSCTRR